MTPPRLIATAFALVAFAGALFVGLRAGNPMLTILSRALLIMLGCYVIGRLVGFFADRVLQGQVADYHHKHPLGRNADADRNRDDPAVERQAERIAA